MTGEQIADATTAIVEMQRYVDESTNRRAKDREDDLITSLLAAEADGEPPHERQTVTMIANLLVAGDETAGSQIGAASSWRGSIATRRPVHSTTLPFL